MCPRFPPGPYFPHCLSLLSSVFCLPLACFCCHGNNSLTELITEQTATCQVKRRRGMLALPNECDVRLEEDWRSDEAPTLSDVVLLFFKHFYKYLSWPILFPSVKGLIFSLCNLTTLRRRKACWQMFHGESLSPIKAVPSLSVPISF